MARGIAPLCLTLALAGLAAGVPVVQVPPRASTPPLGWGKDGHIITGLIAQQLLSKDATNALNTILADAQGQLSNVVNWADQVKSKPEYHWSGPLHFINTPDWECTYEHSRDCVDDWCVAGAISNYTTRAKDTTGSQLEEAVKFLVHFIGDIHQPLHVGFTTDKGGNTIQVEYLSKRENLHVVWDSYIIYTKIDNDFSGNYGEYADYLVGLIQGEWKTNATQWLQCEGTSDFPCPDEWAVESIGLACSNAYVGADGKTPIKSDDSLGQDYFERNQDVVSEQLAKAGVRMAATLNQQLASFEVPN